MTHLRTEQLEAGLEAIRQSPRDGGAVRLIVRRPAIEAREVPDVCELDTLVGLVGDNWKARGSRHSPDGAALPDSQLTLMNARAAQLVAQSVERWPLAGDQLYVDLDLSSTNLPPGTRLAIGTAVVEITATPHTGCNKFVERFGRDAMKFVNAPAGRALNLRGIYARVVRNGTVRVGDLATKVW
jgi:MOSC domain-containing protein YiiM